MPIKIPRQLPAWKILENEHVFVMDESRANMQDIRPLNIVILNLMPEKEKTETQLIRLLANTALQVNITLLYTSTYEAKNVSPNHLNQFYSTFSDISHRRYDGMIITGAPIEKLPFEDVKYWQELTEILEWTKTHVTSVLHICWGAQVALYYHYGIGKLPRESKIFGVFDHTVSDLNVPLVRGFDEMFLAPHSRHTNVDEQKLKSDDRLVVLAESEEAGPLLILSKDNKHVMITGHLEYDATTLMDEYQRDQANGLAIDLPVNYFPSNDPSRMPLNRWRSHGHLLFSNWLNYYVYQQTPYDWE
ncbi:homoserine O-succinyltransferase [Pullulanibacillus sp. KACC 23026]|uniref:homoserine O-acetyltransferase MetA n=1 Tax=Pullulanibacillus sp. KACC 23026 TaxID=3028315 RepID=UPI0023AF6ACD|nr:homoserine O-succinyltransferase [Pullulanibacillus sp. KACC 23026]WEG13159.1 homoserine O-succinyltransferase [Pullulanibacillus sp. KACC 23026]